MERERPASDGSSTTTDPETRAAVFGVLGDETRLAILLSLWERYDPHGTDNAVPFSTLRDDVDYDNPGNFSYHLDELRGHFVHQRGKREGYELTSSGLKLVQAIVAGAGRQDVTLKAAGIDQPCPLCGAATEISYRDGLLFHACSSCAGPTPDRADGDGVLSVTKFEPAGLANRPPDAIYAASEVTALHQIEAMFDGVCPTCAGRVDSWLECCPEHDTEGQCSTCGTAFAAWVRFECQVCKDHGNASPKALAIFHPAMVAFYENHDVRIRVTIDDPDALRRAYSRLDAHAMRVTSDDPPRVDVTATVDGDRCTLTFDESAAVVDVSR